MYLLRELTDVQAEGGCLFPDKASSFICGVYDKDTYDAKVDWWKEVWSHDMTVVGKQSLHEVFMNFNEVNYLITDHVKTLVSRPVRAMLMSGES